jgi:hypothetical protein
VIDKNRATTSGVGTIDIPPAVANEKAFSQIDLEGLRRAQKHPGLWFPALTWFSMSGAGVKTDLDRIQRRESTAEAGVHRLDDLARERPAPDIRLVRDGDKKEPGFLELRTAVNDVRIKLEVIKARWRLGKPIAHPRPIEHAVPIQEDGTPPYFVLSHFVCALLSAGWETNKCQTTA